MRKTLLLPLIVLFLPGCLPLALNAAQNDRMAVMQKQSDERYMEVERRLAALEAQKNPQAEAVK